MYYRIDLENILNAKRNCKKIRIKLIQGKCDLINNLNNSIINYIYYIARKTVILFS